MRSTKATTGRAFAAAVSLAVLAGTSVAIQAQVPSPGEVRQLVTFRFLPGKSADAIDLFRERAVPLYRKDDAMLSFRAFREVESPTPLDLIVVSAFRGMEEMDRSNATLRVLAEEVGTSVGTIYGDIAALSVSHDDQFVEMLASLAHGDPSARPLVALVWYRARPGHARGLLSTLERDVLPWERSNDISSATGRFLVSDGWDYLRIVGFDSLGDYQDYWSTVNQRRELDEYTAVRREVILAPMPELAVR